MIPRQFVVLTAAVLLIIPGIFILKSPGDKPLIPKEIIIKADTLLMVTGENPYTFKKRGKTWSLETEDISSPCIEGYVESFLEKLSKLKILKTAGETKDVWGDLGVQDGSRITTTIFSRNSEIKLIWGKVFQGGSRIFVRRGNDETVYVTDFPGDYIYTDRWEWIDLSIFPKKINTDNIIAVLFDKNGDNYSIIRKSGWILRTKTGTANINSARTEALLKRISGLRGESLEPDKNCEVFISEGTVAVELSDGRKFTLDFCKPKEGLVLAKSNVKPGYLFKISAAEMSSVFPDLKYILDNF